MHDFPGIWYSNTRFQLSYSRAKRTLLIGTEPVELFCGASIISIADPFDFVKQKQEAVKVFLEFFYRYAQLRPACTQNENSPQKSCLVVLTTIKQGNQNTVPNRNPKHNQVETTTHHSFRHVYALTKNGKNTCRQYIYCTVYEQMHLSYIRVKLVALFNHRAKIKERQYNKEKALEVIRRKLDYYRLLLLSRGQLFGSL